LAICRPNSEAQHGGVAVSLAINRQQRQLPFAEIARDHWESAKSNLSMDAISDASCHLSYGRSVGGVRVSGVIVAVNVRTQAKGVRPVLAGV
jgi:hypothetical protein